MILKRNFYSRSTIEVAKDLLGCVLVRKVRGKEIRAMITDVEAYIGEDDLACHASKGRTKRTEIMYGKAGHAYVYMIYGMYYIINIITEKENFPAAVMIRAVKIDGVDFKKTNGPGKVCRELGIDQKTNGADVTKKDGIWFEVAKKKIPASQIVASKRIGIAYAKHCADYLWRFSIDPEKVH